MIELLYKKGAFEEKFLECMKKYESYYWATAWAGSGKKFDAYQLLLQDEYKSRIKVLAIGVYDQDGYKKTSTEFIKNFMNTDGVYFIGYIDNEKHKGMNPLHAKEYLFYTDDSHWEAFIGSANFTQNGFNKNHEAVLHFDQKSGNINEIMSFFNDKEGYLLSHVLPQERLLKLIQGK